MGRPKNNLIWAHYRETENKSATCRYCEKQYKIATLQKMARHLLKCINSPEDCKRQLRTSSTRTEVGDVLPLRNKENEVPAELNVSTENIPSSSKVHLSDRNKEDLHKLLAKAIYVTGTPLSMVEHPLWINFIEKLQPLYKLPSRKTISTSFLDKTYNDMHRELKDELRSQKCLHLQLDGWSDCRNEGIINVIISKPEPIFVKSIATEDNRHTSEYICEVISNVLSEYGPQKFSTLIGDNASNMQRAFRLVKEIYPHLTSLNCAAHTLHLLCKNIVRINVLNACKDIATNLIKTVKRSQVLTSLLQKIVKEKGVGETLKLPCDTRWGSYHASFKSLENTKVALQTLAVHERATLLPVEEKSALLDENFWEMLKQCIIILKPISDAILKLESNEENIHKVFLTLKNIKSKLLFTLPNVTIIEDDIKDKILEIVDSRTNMCLKSIHFAAYMLDPAAQGAELDENQEADAMEFIYEVGQSIGISVLPNLASYRAKVGFWKRRFLWEKVNEIRPTTWWNGFCGSTALSKIAVRILTAPCTSAAVERSFSAHSNIHSKRRNRLTTERAAKITYICYNWNLLHKNIKDIDDAPEECICNSPPTVDSTPPHAINPETSTSSTTASITISEPSTSGTQNFIFLDCDRISQSSDDDD